MDRVNWLFVPTYGSTCMDIHCIPNSWVAASVVFCGICTNVDVSLLGQLWKLALSSCSMTIRYGSSWIYLDHVKRHIRHHVIILQCSCWKSNPNISQPTLMPVQTGQKRNISMRTLSVFRWLKGTFWCFLCPFALCRSCGATFSCKSQSLKARKIQKV